MNSLHAAAVMLALLVASTARDANADVELASVFGDHMVLQRDVPLPVWGKAEPGERIVVSLRDDQRATVADAQGKWRVDLPRRAASAVPFELRVAGRNEIVIHDVVVGEVWVCAGQSNMEWTLAQSANGEDELST
jgi:sialate O-acetylesterase